VAALQAVGGLGGDPTRASPFAIFLPARWAFRMFRSLLWSCPNPPLAPPGAGGEWDRDIGSGQPVGSYRAAIVEPGTAIPLPPSSSGAQTSPQEEGGTSQLAFASIRGASRPIRIESNEFWTFAIRASFGFMSK